MKLTETLIIAGISAAVSVGVAIAKGDSNEKRVEKVEAKIESLEQIKTDIEVIKNDICWMRKKPDCK